MASTIPPQPDTVGFAPGHQISGYRLGEQIGRGGMAVVYGAYDERLERQVALKILAPAIAQDEIFRKRFIAESRVAAAVEDPHIIPIYEAGEADGVLFIAMRLVPGGDLRTLVAQRGPLTPGRAVWILWAVASALDAAHASGLVHRDVKPANMLLDVRPGRPDHVYLSDFGVSKTAVSSGGLTSSGQFLGTVDYAAPEQILGQQVDGRSDQYALGCAAFELLCGHPPYSGKQLPAAMYSHVSGPPPVATAHRPDLPAAVDRVFARVLAKSPADRYENCQEFVAALRSALSLKSYVAEGAAASDRARPDPEQGGSDDDTLGPVATHRPALGIAGSTGVGTDPRPTSQLTAGANRSALARRSRRMLVGGAVAVVLVAGALAAFLLGRGPSPASVALYPFGAPQHYPGGLAIRQRWTLGGPGGSVLDVRMTVRNSSDKKVNAQLDEPIPVGVAPDPGAVTFSGAAKPLATGRLVVWDLRLAPYGQDVVSYQVQELPSGVSEQRLGAFVQAYYAVSPQQALELIAHLGRFSNVWISPRELRLNVSQAGRLTVHGRLYNGKLASRRDLTGAVWTTANPAVLFVDRTGRVVGMSPGRVAVWVQVGGIRAQATVVVNGVGGPAQAPSYPSQPSGQSTTSPSPSGSVTPSPSTTPTSGSPSPSTPPTGTPTAGTSPGTTQSRAGRLDKRR